MNIADDFKTNVRDDASLRAFLSRHGIDAPVGHTTHAWSLVYMHPNGRAEALMTSAPDHPTSAVAYVIRD